jgi:3-oxoadipate enol-lactonase
MKLRWKIFALQRSQSVKGESKMYALINDIRMAYSDRGRGQATALILVHGFPLDRRLWSAQVGAFANLTRVITPDLRGHGRSQVVPGPYTMDQHADDLVALLDHLEIRQTVVAGLSMGGYVAFAFWRRHPERVRGLILADTRAEPDSEAARAGRDAAMVKVQQVGAAVYADEMLPRLLAPGILSDVKIAGAARRIMAEQPVAGIVGALGGLRDRADSGATLPTITVPTLVIAGDEDVITPPADAQALAAAIPGVRLAIIPRSGHLSPLENPRAFNAAVRTFLRGL